MFIGVSICLLEERTNSTEYCKTKRREFYGEVEEKR